MASAHSSSMMGQLEKIEKQMLHSRKKARLLPPGSRIQLNYVAPKIRKPLKFTYTTKTKNQAINGSHNVNRANYINKLDSVGNMPVPEPITIGHVFGKFKNQFVCPRNHTCKDYGGLECHLLQFNCSTPKHVVKCDFCVMRFTTSHECSLHMRMIHASRRSECSKCKKSFKTIQDCFAHAQMAHGTGNLPCTYCSMVFFTMITLFEHIERSHRVTNKCSYPNVVQSATKTSGLRTKEEAEMMRKQGTYRKTKNMIIEKEKKSMEKKLSKKTYKKGSSRVSSVDIDSD